MHIALFLRVVDVQVVHSIPYVVVQVMSSMLFHSLTFLVTNTPHNTH